MENTINVNQESHGVKHTGIPAFLLGNFIIRLRRWPENKTALLAVLDYRGRVTVCCVLDCALQWAWGYAYPGKQLTAASGTFPLPSFDHPRDNAKSRADTFIASKAVLCQAKT